MQDVVEGEGAGDAVFEPLLGGLVAADVEVPCGGWHAVEVLVGVTPNTAGRAVGIGFPARFFDRVASGDGVAGDEIGQGRMLH